MKWLVIGIALIGYAWFSSGGKSGVVAQTIIRQGLKDPNSADFHSIKVVWSKNDLSRNYFGQRNGMWNFRQNASLDRYDKYLRGFVPVNHLDMGFIFSQTMKALKTNCTI